MLEIVVSPQDLQDIVDRFGEDPAGWPVSQRVPAQELIDDCQEARAIIEQAKRLRAALRDMGPDAPGCFSERIVALALELDPPAFDEPWLWRRAN
jgi:hypothetical protein